MNSINLGFSTLKKRLVQMRLGFVGVGILSAVLVMVVLVGVFGQNVLAKTGLIGEDLMLNSFNSPKQSANLPAAKSLVLMDYNILVPEVSAVGVWVEDLATNRLLTAKNSGVKLLPASTTKMMTALVALDHFKFDDDLVVTQESVVGGSSMNLVVGERLSFRALLYGMMLNSGNDAAYTIASNYPGGVENFVEQMNQKAVELGLSNTHFTNPAGYDGENHFTSVDDLAKIAKAVIANENLARVVATKETIVVAENQPKSHSLSNLNELLGEEGVVGIKTGFTEKSGENLVTLVDRGNRKVLLVVLGSKDRFGETKKLLDWAYTNFSLEWR